MFLFLSAISIVLIPIKGFQYGTHPNVHDLQALIDSLLGGNDGFLVNKGTAFFTQKIEHVFNHTTSLENLLII